MGRESFEGTGFPVAGLGFRSWRAKDCKGISLGTFSGYSRGANDYRHLGSHGPALNRLQVSGGSGLGNFTFEFALVSPSTLNPQS